MNLILSLLAVLFFFSYGVYIAIGNCECGEHDDRNMVLIINGTPAHPGEHPYFARLGEKNREEVSWFGGGTVISEDQILTAAHLFTDTKTDVVAAIGIVDISEITSSNTHSITSWFCHKGYNIYTKFYDICILFSKDKLIKDLRTQRICLADTGSDYHQGLVMGMGMTQPSGGQPSPHLMEAWVTQKDQYCTQVMKNFRADIETCASEEGIDSCQGDSGGPLMVYEESRSVQVGIVSSGGDCADPEYPGIYTRVSGLKNWINIWSAGKVCWVYTYPHTSMQVQQSLVPNQTPRFSK